MVETLLGGDSKLVKVPKLLADQLKLVSGRLGTSLSEYTTQALAQALRVDDMGSRLEEAVDTYELVNLHRGAGLVNLPRNSLYMLLASISDEKSGELDDVWWEAGRWYASYLLSVKDQDSVLDFFQNDLRVMWNMDEVEIQVKDVMVSFRGVSFDMSQRVTDLLGLYTTGFFKQLGYEVNEEDILRGLLCFKFLKKSD